jgi:hypothetical protein
VSGALPPFEVLAAALRRTTEQLASELVSPTESPPKWNDVEWAVARSAAALQGISTLLANNLLWSGPRPWLDFLAQQREQSVLRDARIDALLDRIDAAARERGVACVALKGAALRALTLYGPGERPMGDVDLLVAPNSLLSVAQAMTDIGYAEAFAMERHQVYGPREKAAPCGFGEHPDNPLKIEIHTAVAEPLPVSMVAITERLWSGHERVGLNNYPDLVALFLHLLLHAAGNMRAHALRQIQLHDIAVMGELFDERDWQALLRLRLAGERPWWLYPPLVLTARYYPGKVPAEVLRAARALCPRVLRAAAARYSLTDVSWSNLRIHALPGVAWARTPLEALRFGLTRALPSRRALATLEIAQRAQPELAQVPWYGVSHASRVVRWLFTKPPRVQTMVSVRAALESVGLAVSKRAD